MKKLLQRQDGIAMIFVMAFMALSIPMVTAALGLASTLSLDSRIKTSLAIDQYCALGGSEHALYRVLYDAAYMDSLAVGEQGTYTIDCNGEPITITIVKLSEPPDPVTPSADDTRRLFTRKEVTPNTAIPSAPMTYTFTIAVENGDDEPENLTHVKDKLPAYFTYVSGSTSGVTTDDPTISSQELTWDLTSLGIVLQPGETQTLTFNANASVGEGNYCNVAWAEPGGLWTIRRGELDDEDEIDTVDDDDAEGEDTGTDDNDDSVARIEVGFPSNNLCPGGAVSVMKTVTPDIVAADTDTTYTYTITIRNTGTWVLSMSQLRDLLPPAGFAYVPVSVTGNITNREPTLTSVNGREHMQWDFSPALRVLPGQTKTLSFQATAIAPPGDYYNELWVTFDQFSDPFGNRVPVYTWPTARIKVMSVIETLSDTPDGDSAIARIWIGSDSYLITESDLN
jgi:uncharacterized repeat protein (TIGR01451 family)